jgi:signal transduction histidine kinase
MAIHTAETLREIVWYINPSYDTLENLILRLREIAAQMLKRVDYSFSVDDALVSSAMIRLDLRRNTYLSYKEILYNILKHSKATNVDITLELHRNFIKVRVRDNGVGFETGRVNGGAGLKNLSKRVQTLNGNLFIQSAPGEGTEITFTAKIT